MIANGIAECRRSLALDPNLADAQGSSASANITRAIARRWRATSKKRSRLSPRDTRAFLWYMFVGLGKLLIHADREAIDWFRRSLRPIEISRSLTFTWLTPGACGGPQGGAISAEAGLALDPGFTIRRYDSNCSKVSGNPVYG